MDFNIVYLYLLRVIYTITILIQVRFFHLIYRSIFTHAHKMNSITEETIKNCLFNRKTTTLLRLIRFYEKP